MSADGGLGGRLLADVGGTNARFAWQAAPGAPIENARSYGCADHASLQAAIEAYLRDSAPGAPVEAAIGIANPVLGDAVRMTNHHWSFSTEQLRRALGLQRLLVLNDFTALALAVPSLRSDEKRQLCGDSPVPDAAIAVIGPGTGLGVSGLIPDGAGGWRALQGEGGHATLASATERERAVLDQLQRRFGHASAERAVSGPGLVWMYEALCALDGVAAPERADAATIANSALQRTDARADEALELLFAFLGSMAGNLALTLGARGGVYLGGGVLPRVVQRFEASAFRERFVAKGRFRAYLETVPVFLIEARESPALRGVAAALNGH